MAQPNTGTGPLQLLTIDTSFISALETTSSGTGERPQKRKKLTLPDVTRTVRECFPDFLNSNGKLSKSDQHKLLRILIGALVDIAGYYPSFETQDAFADAIVKAIPGIQKAALYNRVPGAVLSGYIPERLKYIRPKEVKKKRRNNEGSKEPLLSPSVCSNDPGGDEEGIKEELKFSHHPYSALKTMMDATFNLRRKEADDLTGNLAQFLQDWPRLTDAEGMIDLDFARLYPTCAEFKSKWTELSPKIMQYAEQRGVKWREVLGIQKEVPTRDDLEMVAVFILTNLIMGGYKMKSNGKTNKMSSVKVSSNDSRNYLVKFLKVGNSLDEYVNSSIPSQPFILCIGDSSALDFQQTFFIVERRCVETESFLKALDLCFKCYLLFHISFPTECRQVWNFLGNSVYTLVNERALTSTAKALKQYCES